MSCFSRWCIPCRRSVFRDSFTGRGEGFQRLQLHTRHIQLNSLVRTRALADRASRALVTRLQRRLECARSRSAATDVPAKHSVQDDGVQVTKWCNLCWLQMLIKLLFGSQGLRGQRLLVRLQVPQFCCASLLKCVPNDLVFQRLG